MRDTEFVVLEWIEQQPHFPRYGFATIKHAEELGNNVRWHERCPSLEQAAASTQALNQQEESASPAF